MTSDDKQNLYFWNLHKKSIQDSLETELEKNFFVFWTTLKYFILKMNCNFGSYN